MSINKVLLAKKADIEISLADEVVGEDIVRERGVSGYAGGGDKMRNWRQRRRGMSDMPCEGELMLQGVRKR